MWCSIALLVLICLLEVDFSRPLLHLHPTSSQIAVDRRSFLELNMRRVSQQPPERKRAPLRRFLGHVGLLAGGLLPSKVIAAERAPTSIVARATSRGRQETTTKEEEPTSAPNNNNNNRQSPRDVWSGVKKAISSADMDEVRLGLPGFGAITARDRKMGTSSFVRDAVRTVGSAVVRVDCEREVSPMQMMLQPGMYQEGDTIKVSGSGFVASTGEEDGRGGGGVLILTNQHVIDSSKKSTVSLANGRTYRCSVVAEDELTDLAVLKVDVPVEEAKQLALAPLGDSSTLQSGDWVIAVGCPVGLDFSCSLGIVSSPLRSASEVGATHLKGTYIQTDAALNSGNSGGPLVNDKGEVVGINTMVRTNTEAIGFAIPINRARAIFEVLRQGKKPTHAYFGLEVSSITPDFAKIHNDDPNAQRLPQVHGALVRKVLPGSPAASCGLRRNDIIIEVNGKSVSGTHDADGYLDSCEPGKVATIKVARGEDGREFVIKATPQNLLSMIEEKRRKRAGQASSR